MIADLINCFSPPAILNKDADALWGEAMLHLINNQNTFRARIEREHLDTKRNWVNMDAAMVNPSLIERENVEKFRKKISKGMKAEWQRRRKQNFERKKCRK